jgi:hypothetical protein
MKGLCLQLISMLRAELSCVIQNTKEDYQSLVLTTNSWADEIKKYEYICLPDGTTYKKMFEPTIKEE